MAENKMILLLSVGEWLHGERHGQFRIDSNGDISFLEGTYVKGRIQGPVQYCVEPTLTLFCMCTVFGYRVKCSIKKYLLLCYNWVSICFRFALPFVLICCQEYSIILKL
jgi:hypothetical protein